MSPIWKKIWNKPGIKRARQPGLWQLTLTAILLALALTGFFTLHIAAAPASTAAINDGLTIGWFTIDNGGGSSSGGNYILTGSAGQPEASITEHSGGTFYVRGGFWQPGMFMRKIFVPMVNR